MPLFLLLRPIFSASCSFLNANYCVYSYLRHAVQKDRLSGSNYAKANKCPVKKMKLFFFYPPEVGTHLFTRLIYFTCGFNISFFFLRNKEYFTK